MSELYNCHTHIFNIKNAPEKFLQGFKGKFLATIAWPILNTKIGAAILIKLLKRSRNPHNKKLASFLKVGTMNSQNDIFKNLKSYYQPGNKFVILTLNMDHMGAGKVKHDFNEQIHELKRIKAQNPDVCLPFYSVDPRAGDGWQLKERAEEHISKKGYVGIKIYPALGFYPYAPNMDEVYDWASKNDVPVMTHCTRVGSYYLGEITDEMKNPHYALKGELKNWPSEFNKVQFPIKKYLKSNKNFCDFFSEIYNYAVVLENCKNLKLCFAHAGGDKEIKKSTDDSWFKQIKYLMKNYDNVYTDISYTLYYRSVQQPLLELIRDPDIGGKVLFGTDFFMTLREATESRLISRFRSFLEKNSKNDEDLWKKITIDNPKKYLTSKFYKA